ncbi:MAG: transglycosylase SLT domain-containing protein [Deltaproteobacteria bacterium]
MSIFRPLSYGFLVVLAGCVASEPEVQPMNFAMQWDQRPEAAAWTTRTVTQVTTSPLVQVVPSDITAWCPAYPEQSTTERAAFWAGAMSAIARYESTWNPAAKGGRGRYHGMMQISPNTAASAGCTGNLFNGADNLSCATKIAARQAGSGRTVGDILGDWGPMHSGEKRASMAAWTREQSYCKG